MVDENDIESSEQSFDEFTSEAEEIVEKLGSDLLRLSGNKEAVDPATLNSIFRSAHTLKGLAGMFGLNSLTEVSHNMENLLDSLRLGKINISDKLLDILFECLEVINDLVKDEEGGIKDRGKVDDVLSGLERVMNEEMNLQRHSPLDSLNIDPSIISVLTEYEEHRLMEGVKGGRNIYLIHAAFNLEEFDKGLGEINSKIKDFGEVVSTLPSSGGAKENCIEFDILYSSDKSKAFIEEKIGSEEVSLIIVHGDGFEKGKAEDTRREEEERIDEASSIKGISKTVRVDISKLDNLMNIVGELLISRNSIGLITERVKAIGDHPAIASSLHRANRDLERKLYDLQEGMMEIRMVSLTHLFDRLAMTVRKIARSHNKEIDLKIFGADTKLDKLIIEEIGDPLMHIIRNAVDHGIEPPELRREAGKSEQGKISIKAYQKGNNVSLEIEDDGAGLDKDKIRRKAEQKGLIEGGKDLTDDEVMDLIFTPGFSTRSEISEISGRGVGMDVVKNNLTKLSGHIDVESEKGKGTKICITLPITLAIIQALIVETSSKIYAIPLNSVQESLLVGADEIETVEKREVIHHRNSTLPLVRLEEIFNLPKSEKKSEQIYVVMIAIAQHRFGIVVDNLQGQQDIVIKSIGEVFNGIKGIAGATDLGNNQTVLVLDVASIVEEISGA